MLKLNEITFDEWIDYQTSILDAAPIIEFLLNWLEEEHIGMRACAIQEMKEELGIDVEKLLEMANS